MKTIFSGSDCWKTIIDSEIYMGYLNSVISVIVKSNSYLPLHLYLVCICFALGCPCLIFFKDICQIHFVWYEKSWCGSEVFGGNDKSIKPVSLGFINVQCAVRFIKISFFSPIWACILLVNEIYASLRKTNNTILERKGHQGDGFPIAICIKDRLNDQMTLSGTESDERSPPITTFLCQWYSMDNMHTAFFLNNGNSPE